jgi:drug/metabolite transporter (DMT)-like permease
VSAPPTSTPSLHGHATASRAALAASAASIFFGASVVATRYVVPQTTPVVLAFVRYVVATSCLLVVLGRRAFPVMPRRDRVQVALLGVLFFGVFPWSFSASLTHLPTAQVALIAATNPLVTLALSVWRGIEPLRIRTILGQILAFAGLAVALAPTGDATVGVSNPLVGYLEIGTTALCGATYNVWSRPLLARYDALAITAQSMLAGTVALAPLALAQGLFSRLLTVTPLGWAAVLFLGIFGGAVGFGLWIWALRHSTPSRVAVFLALNPITAITLGVVLLGESAGVRLIVALAMVIAGIQLASKT